MPNWWFLLVCVVYHLGLALWIGGILVLGALVAPSLFRKLERPVAGALFGVILRKFTRLRAASLAFVAAAAGGRYLLWESHAFSTRSGTWLLVRWLALAVMAVTVAHDLLLESRIESLRVGMVAGSADDRATFDRLHKRSETVMKLGLLAAVVAAFFS